MTNDEQKISDQIDGGQLAMKEAEKQQTAMQEMIERIDKLLENHVDAGLLTCREIAVQLLPKEREKIEDAYNIGSCADMIEYGKGSDYYNKTFQS